MAQNKDVIACEALSNYDNLQKLRANITLPAESFLHTDIRLRIGIDTVHCQLRNTAVVKS